MRTSKLVECSQTISRPSASSVIPLPLLLGSATTSTPPCSSQRRRVSAGMSEKSRNCPSGFQIGPSVKVKPLPSCLTSTFSSTSRPSLSDLTSTELTLPPLYVERGGETNTGAGMGQASAACPDEPRLVLGSRLEVERERVDAVPLPGRLRPVREDVAEVRVARGAADLDAAHAVGRVGLGL